MAGERNACDACMYGPMYVRAWRAYTLIATAVRCIGAYLWSPGCDVSWEDRLDRLCLVTLRPIRKISVEQQCHNGGLFKKHILSKYVSIRSRPLAKSAAPAIVGATGP